MRDEIELTEITAESPFLECPECLLGKVVSHETAHVGWYARRVDHSGNWPVYGDTFGPFESAGAAEVGR